MPSLKYNLKVQQNLIGLDGYMELLKLSIW
jgi:hypothetical protein